MSELTIYFLLKLDDFHDFLVPVIVMSIIGSLATALILAVHWSDPLSSNEEVSEKLTKVLNKFSFRFILFLVFAAFAHTLLPTTKQAAAIYLIPKVANNEQIQGITKNSLSILEEYTKKALEEIKDKKD